jgi:hypothetical protein
MTYVHRIKPKGATLYSYLSLNKFTIQMIHVYRDVRRIQKYMKEYQIKSKFSVFNS